MEGISSSMTSALTDLGAVEAGSEIQVKVLKEAMEQAEESVAPLMDSLGKNIDFRA